MPCYYQYSFSIGEYDSEPEIDTDCSENKSQIKVTVLLHIHAVYY